MEERRELPYVSRAALRAYLLEQEWKESSIKQVLKPNGGKLIQLLLDGGIISPEEHGWVVSNEVQATGLLIAKREG